MADFDESVDTPSLAEAFRNAFDESMLEVRVALPCKVVSYDAATRTVSVTPLVGRYVRNLEGVERAESLPVLNTVPVVFPGGGGAEVTFPIQPGDTGELSFHDSSLDEWKASDNQPVIARDIRSHALTDAVFRPGLRSPGGPGNAPRTDAAVFGYATAQTGGTHAVHVTPGGISLGEPSAAYAVALAEQVASALNQLKQAFAFWTPVPMDGGLALKTVLAAYGISTPPVGPPPDPPPDPIEGLPDPPLSWPPTVGSSTVKVKG